MSHPIPQALRDRFDQIERAIMGNTMARYAVFTQMRTAVQAHFDAQKTELVALAEIDRSYQGMLKLTALGCLESARWPDGTKLYAAPLISAPGLTWEAQGEPNQYMLFKDGKWFAAVQMNGEQWVSEQEAFFASIATPHTCTRPPAGWACSRRAGHSGPCAATEEAAD